jgi:hypothetical protein
MTDIYRDTTDAVVTLAVGTAVSVKFYRNGDTTEATPVGNTVVVPYSITRTDGLFLTQWTYTVGSDTYTREDESAVVTPYFTQAELVEHDPDMSTLTLEQVVKLERLVRGVVNFYTGQSFGLESGTVTAYGTGDSILLTDVRVQTITSIAQAAYPDFPYEVPFRPINQGFAVEMVGLLPDDSIKVPAWEESQLGVYVPTASSFVNNVPYLITGEFGYSTVPSDVNLAALTLAEEFSCDENLWRDRYLKTISGDGFDIEFRSDAFVGTGSVIADQLLGKFVTNKLAII